LSHRDLHPRASTGPALLHSSRLATFPVNAKSNINGQQFATKYWDGHPLSIIWCGALHKAQPSPQLDAIVNGEWFCE